MFRFIWTIIGASFSYWKLISIGVLLLALLAGGYRLYYTIVENTENRIKVEILEKSIKDKEIFIEKQKNDIVIRDKIIADRDNALNELEKKYDEITKDLGDDENDPAPKSLQELMKRLNKK